MTKLGLLGKNISHSRSQEVYEKILERSVKYTLFDYQEIDEIPTIDTFFEQVEGLSITAPYKRVFLDKVKLSEDIKATNAINCIKKNGMSYEGTNTDYLALLDIFRKFKEKYSDLNIVLLGDGAMSIVVKLVSEKMNCELLQFSRKKTDNFSELELLDFNFKNQGKVIVINSCSREYLFNGEIDSNYIFYNLNYSCPEQEKLFIGRPNQYIDGMELLEGQARHALKFWDIN
ncbi:MAG: hypothetical protein KC493_03220 [Bacteriovoracaceae bacterium]|nr:hypothetical protein [Bacteriovoracaceae bacterium]